MIFKSCMDPYIKITDNFCAVTLISINNHSQIIGEWVDDNQKYSVEMAHLQGEKRKKQETFVGEVTTRLMTEVRYNFKSKTWSVARDLFLKMWNKILDEEYNPAAHPVYFQSWGRVSIFSKSVTDYSPNDPELIEIKDYYPSLFIKICQEAAKHSKKKPKKHQLCKDNRLWKSHLTIIDALLIGKDINKEQDRLDVLYKLFIKISSMLHTGQIKTAKIKTHNCASWASEKLAIAKIQTLKTPRCNHLWWPTTYAKINGLTKKELKEREKKQYDSTSTSTASTSPIEFNLEQAIEGERLEETTTLTNQEIAPRAVRLQEALPCRRIARNKKAAKRPTQGNTDSNGIIVLKTRAKKKSFCQIVKQGCVIS